VLEQAASLIARFEPDALLLGGDFVSHHERHVGRFLRAFSKVRPRHGTYAVMGNHDFYADASSIRAALEQHGIRVLVNEGARLTAPFQDFSVCGLDDPVTGTPNIDKATAGARGKRILLMHSPGGMALAEAHKFDLAFAGHNHGGQIALPGGHPIVLPRNRHCRRFAKGLFEVPEGSGRYLIVSTGVGCSDLPVRLFAQPEVHLVTIG
jgi:predicted MPP superfamily phosphohydrolase